MNEEELAAALDQQVQSNTNLNTENRLLENFLHRNNATNVDYAEVARREAKKKGRGGGGSGGGGSGGGGGGGSQRSSPTAGDDGDKDSPSSGGGDGGGGGSKRRLGKGKHGPTSLSLNQKNDVASQESDAVGKEIEETRIKSEKLIDTLRSVIEETAIRLTDLKKDAYEFKRDIVVGAENFRTGKTMAEKVRVWMFLWTIFLIVIVLTSICLFSVFFVFFG